ncbi:hypothetical protein CORC01_00815 [Colletotrichum orchidophilum]|uniref:SCP domain-containing protein n=1 Tax=Colletotrichum orchidophilum TaxID=1209926 RepID=A0A1G4BRE9_9PEZI|nr:uncharacterized protein CORC01_00815 [Colletotrichum orchidophilum]OHF03953.1 hypothetical protein CORC01_00815 [Colletotrichum orchidophilum]
MHFSASVTFTLGLLASQAAALNIVKVAFRGGAVGTPTFTSTTVRPTTTLVKLTSATSSSTSSAATASPTASSNSTLTADLQRALDLHNIYRAAVGNANLTWDADLAKSAQAWANHLTTVGSLVHDSNPGGQGENLASQSGGTTTYFTNGVQLWLNEKPLYDGKPIRTTGSPNYLNYGHYTQCIWKGTQKVGLALATDSKGTTFVVGRYLPPGNYVGQMPY